MRPIASINKPQRSNAGMPQVPVKIKSCASRGVLLLLAFLLAAFTVLPNSVMAQTQPVLVAVDTIRDISQTPIYRKVAEKVEGQQQWKPEYKYLDSITMARITYLSDGLKVTGLMVRPKAKGSYPCIIFNRGGNRDFGQLLVAHAATLLGKMASQGYVVIATNYRGNGGGEGREEFGGADVNDVLRLIDVLSEVEGADTSRIGMMGWSRGGMMTYLAVSRTHKIKAVVVGAGMSDLTIIDRPEMEKQVYAELIPDYEQNKEEELRKRSAVHFAEQLPKDVPFLLLHGNADWRVKSTQALKMALAFEEQRIPYRLMIFEGADHGISEFRVEVGRETMSWFDRFLKSGEAMPDMTFHGK